MRILGICHDVIICSAALIEDGRVVAAVAEERLDRQKRSRVFPTRAIAEVLRIGETSWEDVDEVAVAWNPAIEAETTPGGFLHARRWRTEHFMQVPTRLLSLSGKAASPQTSHTELWEGGPPITYVDHYLAHLGNAVFLSPFESCAVCILDGRAERGTGLLAKVEGTKIDIISETLFPHSLGLLYGALTQLLGFRPDSDEWKVMALASYAEADNEYLGPMRELIQVDERGRLKVALDHFEFYNFWDKRMFSDRLVETFGPPRARSKPITERHHRIAAALQLVFEETVAQVLHRLHEQTGLPDVVVRGGCFMNSVFNGKITALTPFERTFISSCPDDSGTSIGAALHLHAMRTGERDVAAMTHNYWGTQYSDAECLEVAKRFKLPNVEVVDDPSHRAAQDLASDRLIGWFQGRAEFGQRALGNRSILADPRSPDAKDRVNAAVKFRESFRPFAPAILVEHVADWFECEPDARVPFMEQVFPFRSAKAKEVPAVVHVDGSGRLQTVDEHSSPRYRRLIEAFHADTGVPIVLNTSFNLNGEPMVEAPEDAVRTFYSCGLDVLYLGNVRIAK